MCAWILPPIGGLIEPAPAPVIWVDGIGALSLADGVLTTYYFSHRASLCGTGIDKTLEVIVKRPVDNLAEQIAQMMQVFVPPTGQPPGPLSPPGRHLHLVR